MLKRKKKDENTENRASYQTNIVTSRTIERSHLADTELQPVWKSTKSQMKLSELSSLKTYWIMRF